jgi:hypothetical protein
MFNTLSCHSEELVHPSITSTPGRTNARLAPFDEWMPFVSNAEVRTIRDTSQPPGRYLSVYLDGAAAEIMTTIEDSLMQREFSRDQSVRMQELDRQQLGQTFGVAYRTNVGSLLVFVSPVSLSRALVIFELYFQK